MSEEGHKKKSKKSSSKSKSKPSSVEDAIEKKLREKKKKEQAAAAAEDALEAKIRAKQKAADGELDDDDGDRIEEGRSITNDKSMDKKPAARSSSKKSNKSKSSTGAAAPSGMMDTSSPLFAGGGGDVRNQPPPSLAEKQQPEVDPLRALEEQKKKNAKQINPRYAELRETGQWGGLSKWGKYGLCVLALVAVGVAIGLGVKFTNEARTDPPTGAPSTSPTGSPSASPTLMPTDETYRTTYGLEIIAASSPPLALRVDTPEELIGASTDSTATPQEIAAEFVLYDDELSIPARDPRFLERYALSVFYYINGGCSGDWIDTTNWMDANKDHCEWYGVICDLQGRVTELAMAGNYVTGELIMELSQMKEMSTMDLSNNRMEGAVLLDALKIPTLYTLRLSNNNFSGDFPFDRLLEGSPILGK